MIFYKELRLNQFDPDALLHILDHTEMEHRLLASGDLAAWVQRTMFGDLTISAGDYHFPVCISGCVPHEQLCVGIYNYLAAEVRENYRVVSPDQLLLYAPGMERQCTSLGQMGWTMVMVPLPRLQETAIAVHGAELDWPRQGIRCLDLNPVLAERLRRELRELLRLGKSLSSLPDEGLTDFLASECLIQLLVQAIVNGTESLHSQPALTAGRRRALAAMEACIRRWKEDPVDELRIRKIAGISERVLELAAREVYGVTPHYWLKLARLNAAYDDLLSGRGTSVTEVCQRWQFHHHGYFARDYRKLFGEVPSETLRRQRRKRTRSATVSRNVTQRQGVSWANY